jgi:hypothetical protein
VGVAGGARTEPDTRFDRLILLRLQVAVAVAIVVVVLAVLAVVGLARLPHFAGELAKRGPVLILAALREADGGLTLSEIRRGVFNDNFSSDRVTAALTILISVGAVTQAPDTATGGRPATRFSVVRGRERRERPDNPPQGRDDTGTFHVNHVNHVHVAADDGALAWSDPSAPPIEAFGPPPVEPESDSGD